MTVDIARGIAIIAIVLGHVLRGLSAAGVVNGYASPYPTIDNALYSFHLAVFAFLAGLFVKKAVDHQGVRSYLRQRDATFLYLYVIWSLIQSALKLSDARLINSPTSVSSMVQLWEPKAQFWFLPFLALACTAAAVVRPWRSRWLACVTVGATVLLSLTTWGLGGSVVGTQGLALSGFFIAGAVWGSERFIVVIDQLGIVASAITSLVAVGLFLVIVIRTRSTPPTIEGSGRTLSSVALGLAASLAGTICVLAISTLLAKLGAYTRWIAFIGTRTLEIFLAHIVAAAGMRIALNEVGLSEPKLQILAGTLAGVTIPLLIWWACQRLDFRYLFAAPRFLSGDVRKEASS